MDEILVQKIIDRIDVLEGNMNSRMDTMQEEINDLKTGQKAMQEEINDLKAGQKAMQEDIEGIKLEQKNMHLDQKAMQHDIRELQQGQHIIIRAVTAIRKDVIQLKREAISLSERIDANSMDVETVDKKAEKIKKLFI